MKTCTGCNKTKPLIDFAIHNGFSDGRNSKCKVCKSTLERNRYNNLSIEERVIYNKQRYIKRANDTKWFVDHKKSLSCSKCGENRWFCLDFHHRDPSIKSDTISAMVSKRKKKDLIFEEIGKCDVLCKNCHAEFHHLDNGGLAEG